MAEHHRHLDDPRQAAAWQREWSSTPLAVITRKLGAFLPERHESPPCYVRDQEGNLVPNPAIKAGQSCTIPSGKPTL